MLSCDDVVRARLQSSCLTLLSRCQPSVMARATAASRCSSDTRDCSWDTSAACSAFWRSADSCGNALADKGSNKMAVGIYKLIGALMLPYVSCWCDANRNCCRSAI